MVNLEDQYLKIKEEIDIAINDVLLSTQFINGPQVQSFAKKLSAYLNVKHVIPCANGTDALQIAMMALGLKSGDEVIVPAFTYVATAEVIALLQLVPIMVDVDRNTFCITLDNIKSAISPKTKAIVPVHLFGQCCDMEEIVAFCKERNIYIIEDNAQAIGADYYRKDGTIVKAGVIGHLGTTSFFPSKNLGCYGDGGAIYTNDDLLASKCKLIANHGQSKKYHHEVIGCNSRLDTLQAAILNVKLNHLSGYILTRQNAAKHYDTELSNIEEIQIPIRSVNSTHVFHQYTILVNSIKRNLLKDFLTKKGIPSMIYYPIPLYRQVAFQSYVPSGFTLFNTEYLCESVLSLPIHTEMNEDELFYITDSIKKFFTP